LTNSTLGSELAINITDGKLFYKDNANAVQVIGWKTTPTTAGGTGLTTYTAGDLSYYASGTTFTKLAIGTTGQILTSTGSAPQWSTLSGVAVTTFSAGTTGFTPNSATSGAVTLAGTLITSNGGTGLSSYTAGDLSYYASGTALTKLAIGATGRFLSSTGSAPQWSAPAALTETDDTNVTMTLGGTPSTALLSSVSMTLGWTGTLAVSRGGTGTGTALTTGSVVFAGASGVYSQDNANFFWNDTDNRLGLGIATPTDRLHVYDGIAKVESTVGGSTSAYFYQISPAFTGGSQNKSAYVMETGTRITDLGFFTNSGGQYGSYLNLGGASQDAGFELRIGGTVRQKVFASGGVSIGNTTDPGAGVLSATNGIYLNTSSAIDSGRISVLFSTATNNGISLRTSSSTTTYNLMSFLNASSTSVGFIYTNGTGTTYGTTSDYRLKDNIQPMTGALEKIAQLRPVTYTWKTDGSEGQGFIAHELQAVVPDCVTGEKDGTRIERYEITPAVPATLDEDGRIIKEAVEAVMGEREAPSYQGVDTSFLVATLTAAIQEQQKQISAFDDRIKFLEKQNAAN
jgi:hypothetical protein